ncbi:uncharacterized protein sb:cb288 [Silurus meridionalis]|uniref:Uncharacterized protein n=1 Tax=Silurus meridionalis TaxID=175797 RepID=A0A8T0AS28_SILME|nr:uncharacterized protein sb:cb288 [Silurus meridionalis]KAF7694920.1 hypothetical protein HF521_006643 [Silurus meridionalis]
MIRQPEEPQKTCSMRTQGRNITVLQHGNLSQVIPPAPAWLPLTSHRNGSLMASPATITERPKRSGIVPGVIAAGIFICFLLALYTALWKCMVSPPRRGKRKRILKGSNATSL